MEIIERHYVGNFYDLKELCWSGALDTLKDIENAEKEEEFMDFLKEVYCCDESVEDTSVNDFIWFERDYIYESLGLDENGEIIEDNEDDEL